MFKRKSSTALIIWKLHSFHLKCGIYTGDTENSKSVREIVYAGRKTQLRVQKDMRGEKLDRNVISGFSLLDFRGKSQIQLRREMKKSIWKQSSKVLEVLQQILLVTEVSVWKHEHG